LQVVQASAQGAELFGRRLARLGWIDQQSVAERMVLHAARILNAIFGAGVDLVYISHCDCTRDFSRRPGLIRIRIERLSNRIAGRTRGIYSLGLRIFLCRFAQRIMNTAHCFYALVK
jgi:hypothetical protein